ncbi:uncharacterized protein LOC113003237 [Solenopsis invicta]|uniref:uncharacterized protein LOC113003237 n=1 Tax=Solenopsis invicta TaxID=13686 RepID=UPI00193D52CE|nr:uncharacterized protein LOC113003237 [Solenopsis invicta]
MGALNFAFPFTVFLYLLPSLPFSQHAYDLEKVATIAPEQSNNLVDIVGIPKEIHGDNGKIEYKLVDDSSNPTIVLKPVRDLAKANVDFQAKVESKNLPLSSIRGDISTNVQLVNQAKRLQNALSKELPESFRRKKNELKARRGAPTRNTTAENKKDTNVFHLYIPDINDVLREKFAKANVQLGLDVGVTSKKDADENKIDVLVVNNRSRGKKNYIRLCERLTDGSITSLMQKLRGKDCVKLSTSEFYLNSGTSSTNWRNNDTVKLVESKIGMRVENGRDCTDVESGSNENKQREKTMDVDASISDISANYDESGMKVADKLGSGLNIKMIDDRIANLLNDGKLSLSASTALKV